MKVTFPNSKTIGTTFGELQVGDTFFDHDGDLCIKTARDHLQKQTNTIFFSEGDWCETICENNEIVIPVKTTLKIED
jgi:hypothetical protein